MVCSAPLLGCVSCLFCCSVGPGTHCHALDGPGRGGSSVSLTAQLIALQPLLCHHFILRFSMSFSLPTSCLLQFTQSLVVLGCAESRVHGMQLPHTFSLLKSRVQMPSPYLAEGWRGLFCLTPEWECLVVPHLPSSGRLGAEAPQASPEAPGERGTLPGCRWHGQLLKAVEESSLGTGIDQHWQPRAGKHRDGDGDTGLSIPVL